MITSCPFCTTDTAGNHEAMCPYYYPLRLPESITPNDVNSEIFVKTSVAVPFDVYNDLIKFLECMSGEYLTACDLLEQLKGT